MKSNFKTSSAKTSPANRSRLSELGSLIVPEVLRYWGLRYISLFTPEKLKSRKISNAWLVSLMMYDGKDLVCLVVFRLGCLQKKLCYLSFSIALFTVPGAILEW